MIKKIISYIEITGKTVTDIIKEAREFENGGADELYFEQFSDAEQEKETFLACMKQVIREIDIPVNVGMYIRRFEDVKKAFYTGAKTVVIRYELLKDQSILKESVQRFGKDAIMVELPEQYDEECLSILKEDGVDHLCIKKKDRIDQLQIFREREFQISFLIDLESKYSRALENSSEIIEAFILEKSVAGKLMDYKQAMLEAGVDVNTYSSEIPFSSFKLNESGLIPVVVQDYRSSEVLMVAYMNEEAYDHTIRTGRMTYYSRSRQQLWIKGETSGNFQYVKELKLDCDNDTILAKVRAAGPACHTGNVSCFFQELMKREYDTTNPFSVFEDVYGVIMDRKIHPKEGSYTNYLFDKGMDKILKKCGEEATEIIIAAKNPDPEEIKYEISDFLYHCMVLMAEKGVDWKEICEELANRE